MYGPDIRVAIFLAACMPLVGAVQAQTQTDLVLRPGRATVSVPVDSPVTVAVHLENREDADATDIAVGLHAPRGLDVDAGQASAGRYADKTWTVGHLAPGRRDTLALSVRLRRATPRILTMRLRTATPPDPTGAAARARIVPAPAQRAVP